MTDFLIGQMSGQGVTLSDIQKINRTMTDGRRPTKSLGQSTNIPQSTAEPGPDKKPLSVGCHLAFIVSLL